jgi:hypothetical protein
MPPAVGGWRAQLQVAAKGYTEIRLPPGSWRIAKMLTTTDEGCAYVRRHRCIVAVMATEAFRLNVASTVM